MKPGIPQGSMVDTAVPKADDLEKAQRHFLAALTPQADAGRHAPISLAPVVRAAAFGAGAASAAARQASLAVHAGAALPAIVSDPTAWNEAFSIASAVARQWQGLGAQWLQGWTELAKNASEWRQPNTMTKLFGQESDLLGQGVSLVTAQVTSTVRVQEDILVGVSWWMSRHALATRDPDAVTTTVDNDAAAQA